MQELVLTPTQIALITVCTTLISLLVQFAVNRTHALLNKHLYITKLKYDTEYSIYRDLCLICSEIINDSEGMYDKGNIEKYKNIKTNNEKLRKEILKNSPFIPNKNRKYFKDFNKQITQMLISYNNCMLEENIENKKECKLNTSYKKYKEFCEKMEDYYENNINSHLQSYIDNLKIIEG